MQRKAGSEVAACPSGTCTNVVTSAHRSSLRFSSQDVVLGHGRRTDLPRWVVVRMGNPFWKREKSLLQRKVAYIVMMLCYTILYTTSRQHNTANGIVALQVTLQRINIQSKFPNPVELTRINMANSITNDKNPTGGRSSLQFRVSPFLVFITHLGFLFNQ